MKAVKNEAPETKIALVDLMVVVAEVNEELLDAPQLINEQPYEAWMIKVENVSGSEELLSAAEYEAFIAQGE